MTANKPINMAIPIVRLFMRSSAFMTRQAIARREMAAQAHLSRSRTFSKLFIDMSEFDIVIIAGVSVFRGYKCRLKSGGRLRNGIVTAQRRRARERVTGG
jgi:hypothetical protein